MLETHSTRNLRSLEMELKEELENINLQEEVLWRQKSNSDFLIWEIRTPSIFMPRQRAELNIHALRCFELVTTSVVMRRF